MVEGAAQGRVKEWIEAADATGSAPVSDSDDSGVWVAPQVRERRLHGGVRVFELLPNYLAVLMPLPANRHAHSLQQLERCDTGWDTLAATAQEAAEGQFNSFRCVPTASQAKTSLSDFNNDTHTQRVLQEVFNVTAPCRNMYTGSGLWELISGKSSARQWLTALHDRMPKDRWHPDGCAFDPRPQGSDMITVLSYPHTEWREEWGGQLEFSAQTCLDGRVKQWDPETVLRVTPKPDLLVMFSGPVLHRATSPSSKAPRSRGPRALQDHEDNTARKEAAAWRYSQVMQLTCFNGRFSGPYAKVMGPFVFRFRGAQYIESVFLATMVLLAGFAMWYHCRSFQLDRPNSRSKSL